MWADLGWALVTDAISTLVALPAVTLLVLFVLRVGPSLRIWGVRSSVLLPLGARIAPTVVISTSSFQENPNYPKGRPQTGIGQVRAIAAISPSIAAAYRTVIEHHRLRMSQDCDLADPMYHGDLITIGGPKTNEVTRVLLEKTVLPDGYGFETATLENGTTVDRITWAGAPVTPGPREALGLVIRCANPLGRAGVLTVLAGAGTFGTEAAAVALTRLPALRPTVRAALRRRRTGFIALVCAETTERSSGISRLYDPIVRESPVPIEWT